MLNFFLYIRTREENFCTFQAYIGWYYCNDGANAEFFFRMQVLYFSFQLSDYYDTY